MSSGNSGLLTVRVPSRIDLAGGWSDVHYFSAREGGAVINAAISPYVEGRASWQDNALRLEYTLSLPPGSHLGTSSSIRRGVAAADQWLDGPGSLVGGAHGAGLPPGETARC